MQRVLFTLTALAIAAVATAQNRGEAIYLEKCASCHGRNLQGGNAQSMVDGVWQFGGGDSELFRNIKFGISAVGMPAYSTLSDDEVRDVIRFIRDAAKREGAQRPPLPEQLATRDYDLKVTKWIEGGVDSPCCVLNATIDQNRLSGNALWSVHKRMASASMRNMTKPRALET